MLAGMLNAAGTPIPHAVIGQALELLLTRAAQMAGRPVDPQLVQAAHRAALQPLTALRKSRTVSAPATTKAPVHGSRKRV